MLNNNCLQFFQGHGYSKAGGRCANLIVACRKVNYLRMNLIRERWTLTLPHLTVMRADNGYWMKLDGWWYCGFMCILIALNKRHQ